jgi:dinuclear metal center YbgI/SA1388 family protein
MIPGPEEIYGALDSRFPFDSAYDWDNSGWQVIGKKPVERCLVALDPGAAAVQKAIEWDAQLILSHHPLFMPHISTINPDSRSGAITRILLMAEIGLLSSHSCADRHIDGISGALADGLDLDKQQVLAPDEQGTFFKLVTFVPDDYLGPLRAALSAAGAGEIGNYEECSFALAGTGTYRPQAGAVPMQGEIGKLEEANEFRLEMRVPATAIGSVLNALKQKHPYDEVAFDLYRTFAQGDDLGIGVLGILPKPVPIEAFLTRIKQAVGNAPLHVTGPVEGEIEVVAVAGGSTADFVPVAASRSAQLFIGGDLKYHELLEYSDSMVCVDAGHRASEHPGVERLADTIRHAAVRNDWKIEVETFLEDPSISRII